MLNCLTHVVNYYTEMYCLKTFKRSPSVVWYLKHGTIVQCDSQEEIKHYLEIEKYKTYRYWASGAGDYTDWEVQFSDAEEPVVKISNIKAASGDEAATIAKEILHRDAENIVVVDAKLK